MFFAACEGYSDKMEEYKVIMRRCTFAIMRAFGSKISREEQIFAVRGDKKHSVIKKVWGSKEEALEMIRRIEESHGIKLRHE